MSVELKARVLGTIITIEGDYTNSPADSGGPTRYGITEAVAREYGYHGDMRHLPIKIAYEIYGARYWDAVCADELCFLSDAIAEEVVDTGVNCGVMTAQKFLQRCLNVFNNNGKRYDDIAEDGHIGPATIHALDMYLKQRDEEVLLKALNCLQGARYIELAEKRKKDEAHVYGWLRARVSL